MADIFLLLSIMAIQGGVIFGTAYWVLRFQNKPSDRLARFTAMSFSYGAWMAVTLVGYTLLGGSGGLMDGFMFVLFLCATATVGTWIYLFAWLLQSSPKSETD